MIQELAEKRSGFRFPAVVPVEYFKSDDSGIASYALNLCKNGAFISSDDPVRTGNNVALNLNIPFNGTSSKIFKTKGIVVWDWIQPFKSKKNGMGVKFTDPLPEDVLLNALADTTKKLIRESEAKKALEERVEKLESELEEVTRLATLGRYVEKILFDVSNPILTLSGKLEIIKKKMHKHKKMLEESGEIDQKECKKRIREFDDYCKNIGHILKDYKVISELIQIVGDDRETFERRLLQQYGP